MAAIEKQSQNGNSCLKRPPEMEPEVVMTNKSKARGLLPLEEAGVENDTCPEIPGDLILGAEQSPSVEQQVMVLGIGSNLREREPNPLSTFKADSCPQTSIDSLIGTELNRSSEEPVKELMDTFNLNEGAPTVGPQQLVSSKDNCPIISGELSVGDEQILPSIQPVKALVDGLSSDEGKPVATTSPRTENLADGVIRDLPSQSVETVVRSSRPQPKRSIHEEVTEVKGQARLDSLKQGLGKIHDACTQTPPKKNLTRKPKTAAPPENRTESLGSPFKGRLPFDSVLRSEANCFRGKKRCCGRSLPIRATYCSLIGEHFAPGHGRRRSSLDDTLKLAEGSLADDTSHANQIPCLIITKPIHTLEHGHSRNEGS